MEGTLLNFDTYTILRPSTIVLRLEITKELIKIKIYIKYLAHFCMNLFVENYCYIKPKFILYYLITY